MDFYFRQELAAKYTNPSQKIRVMSETWMAENMFCPCCGNNMLTHLKNNKPVADFYCNKCSNIFELKSSSKKIGSKIADGAYSTMMKRIRAMDNPSLFVLNYKDYIVQNLEFIPKYFFVPDIIEKRKSLSPAAERSGWIGCNILYGKIPPQGKISIIKNGVLADRAKIVDSYNHSRIFDLGSISKRSWLFDVMECVNMIKTDVFSLNEIYLFADLLAKKHINNNNIHAKIRQQLQFLRDRGLIEFLGRGNYKKLY